MKKLFTGAALILFLATSAFGQQAAGKITGTVSDGAKKTIEAPTVALLAAKDSSVIKYTATDKAGAFAFEDVPAGKYLVTVSAVGHTKVYSEVAELSVGALIVAVKPIELTAVSKSLSAVTVTAKKPLVEQKIDRTVINVEAAITNAGSTAMEVLEKSPGISVDKDGNISLKGKAGVVVLIDGRPTQLGAADLANMLRSMQSSQMDQIEIMTNPPAKFDAAGNAGVINIKTKKNKQFGYNGSITAGVAQGVYTRFNEGANLNYRKNKVNLFANVSHSYGKRDERLNIQRNFMNSTTKEVLYRFEQGGIMTNERNSYNAKIGMDYSFHPKTTIGFVASGFTSPNTFQNLNTTNKSVQSVLQEQTRSVSASKESFRNLSTNLNFRRQLDSAGREITADLDYLTYRGHTGMSLISDYFNSTGGKTFASDTLYGALPQIINIYSGKVDYVHPLKNGARFEAGIKTSIVRTDNNAMYDTMNHGRRQRDLFRSNHFIYEENINAAYVNLSMPFSKKWNGQFGLRAENTLATGTQLTTGERFTPKYTQLFPTAYVQYKMNEKNNFGLNYGRRIRRPNYESLNPFIEYIDQYTFQQGNPNLKPQFSHNGEFSHTYNNILTTTVNYTKTTDIIQQVIEQNEEKSETFVRQANIANQRQYGLALSAGFPVNKWWTSNLYANVFNNKFTGVVDDSPVSITGTTVMLNGSQQFKLSKTGSVELSGWFRSPGVEGVMKIGSMGSVSLGFSQQVLKGMGTVRLTVRDIFDTQNVSGKSRYGNIDAAFQNSQDNRVVNLGFTYRFSKGKMNGPQKRKAGGSASDEQNRVGGGNGN